MPETWGGKQITDADLRKRLVRPERAARKAKKRKAQRVYRLTRTQVRQIVMRRERDRCQRCQRKVSDEVAAWKDERAHVNEPKCGSGRRRKAAIDPDACELVCRKCHFGAPSGGHAPTAARMVKRA